MNEHAYEKLLALAAFNGQNLENVLIIGRYLGWGWGYMRTCVPMYVEDKSHIECLLQSLSTFFEAESH